MRAIILAAGLGRRLAPMGWDKPKCLLPCPQGTLLDNAVAAAMSQGVRDFVIVVGHRRELVEQAANRHAATFEFVVNERFAETNTLHSLWLARDKLRGGFLLFNGDVWFRPEVLGFLLKSSGSAIAVEEKPCGLEEVKVIADPSGRIRQIGKELSPRDCLGEYLGVAKFDGKFAAALVDSLESLAASPGSEQFYYEAAIEPMLSKCELLCVRVAAGDAIEIDTPEDCDRAKKLWYG